MKFQNPVSLINYPASIVQELDLDASQDFMQELLSELDIEVKDSDRGDESHISFIGEIAKVEGKFEEFFQIIGKLIITYYTHDIGTNEVMTELFDHEVNCLVLTEEVGKKLHLIDEIDIQHKGKTFDLYFMDEEDIFDFKTILHENIYLNKNPYPKKDPVAED
jgi:hypothetical protein